MSHVPTATVGNVKTQRPGMWDMLGRAKWYVYQYTKMLHIYRSLLIRDAWAENKDLDSYEAKWLYVDAMLKARCRAYIFCMQMPTLLVQVLRKYSDKTVARDLVQELESFGGDPANSVTSREHFIIYAYEIPCPNNPCS
jgi:hypothetical protein